MNIRKTTPADLDGVLRIYEEARAFMRQKGNPSQWADGYPQRELVCGDIAQGVSYVCEENGQLYAVFALIGGDDPTYALIDGAWLDALPYWTLHRVASTGQARGMMDLIVRWALEQSPSLRGDTHADNLPMQRAFERNGFVRCGVIRLANGDPRVAYHHPAQRAKEEGPCSQS